MQLVCGVDSTLVHVRQTACRLHKCHKCTVALWVSIRLSLAVWASLSEVPRKERELCLRLTMAYVRA